MSEISNGKNENTNKSIFEHILAICGYVLFCVLLMFAAGFVFLSGAGIATVFAGIALEGVAGCFGGLILVGVGITHVFSLPRASLIHLGCGIHLVAAGILTELFLFWFVLDAVPWIIGKIRKRPPRVMAKDIRALVFKVLRIGITGAVIGLAVAIAGVAAGGINDIGNLTVTAFQETREAMEDTIEVLPFSDHIQNLKLLTFDYTEHSLELSFAETSEKLKGTVAYTVLENSDEIHRMKVSALSGRLDIRQSASGEYAFESFDSGEYQVFSEGDTLYVNVFPYIHRYSASAEPQIVLYVPSGCSVDNLDIYFSGRNFNCEVPLSGEEATVLFPKGSSMSFSGLDFDEIKMQNGLGNISVDSISAERLITDIGAGIMTLNDVSVAKLKANISSGRFRFFGNVSEEADICCGTGIAYIEPDRDEFHVQDYSLYLTGTPVKMQIGDTEYKKVPLFEYQRGSGKRIIKADARGGSIIVN